jgi:hypothetical protein
MFAAIKSLIPEPRQQADQPRNYVGRHRREESAPTTAPSPEPATEQPAAATV